MNETHKNALNTNPALIAELDAQAKKTDDLKSWLITIGISAIIVAAIFLYRNHKTSNEEKASRMLGEARNIQALTAIINQYPSSAAATLARLQSAKAQYDRGEYAVAQLGYKDFLSKHSDHKMRVIAELGLIQCTEGLGQVAQALSAYDEFAKKNPAHYLAPVAIFAKARCLETLKRYPEARATYEDFLAAHPESYWTPEVEEALKLLARHARTSTVKL